MELDARAKKEFGTRQFYKTVTCFGVMAKIAANSNMRAMHLIQFASLEDVSLFLFSTKES